MNSSLSSYESGVHGLAITHNFSHLKPVNKNPILLTSLLEQKMRHSDVKERASRR